MKLLRAIESRSVRRVGAPKEAPVDVRIVAATNRRLRPMVNDGTFREDPRDDIPRLARHLFAKIVDKNGLPAAGKPWPGNVRELRNSVERAVTLGELGEKREIAGADSESIVPLHLPLRDARLAWTSEFEMVYACAMLEKTGGNLTRAAEQAGVSRRFFQRPVARLDLRGARSEDEEDD